MHKLWWQCFDDINAVLQPVNPGYTAWTPIFCREPYYIQQCDFAYMIGPETFDEFIKPELEATMNAFRERSIISTARASLPTWTCS